MTTATTRSTYPERLELTPDRVKEVLDYDPITGTFRWKVATSNRVKVGSIAGTVDRSNGYRQIKVDGHLRYEHRLAWFVTYGDWPSIIDHINGVPTDNRISNLREATASQNNANRRSRCSFGRGVQRNKTGNRYEAKIKIDGKLTYIGSADTPEAAQELYAAKAKEVFGEYARAS